MNIKVLGATLGAVAIGLSVSVAPSEAAVFNNSTGLTNPGTTLTFNEVPLSNGTPVTNQYAGFGVNFTGLFYNPENFSAPNISSPTLGNFDFISLPNPLFSIKFLQQQTAAAFAMITNPGSSTFTALLNGSAVESFSASTDYASSNNFYGFTNILFDEVQVSAGGSNNAALIDNLQFNSSATAVPTPALLPGLIGMGIAAYRKRKGEGVEQPSEA